MRRYKKINLSQTKMNRLAEVEKAIAVNSLNAKTLRETEESVMWRECYAARRAKAALKRDFEDKMFNLRKSLKENRRSLNA